MALAGLDELVELALALQFDLQFGDVEVLGVVKFAEQDCVHQLGDPLGDLPGVPLLGDLEEDDLGGKSAVDRVEQVGPRCLSPICCLNSSAKSLPGDFRF